ncbi:MAG: ChbG/HpnK family deacetylase [Nitrospirae bacterium]|nr:ChbG/HpnK family deacetylase [Nitrospirota bacterium]
MSKKLILNADDLGLRRSINASVEELLVKGLITSATIMVKRGADSLKEALDIARKISLRELRANGANNTNQARRISFGLHLDLDEYFLFDEIGRYGDNEMDVIENYREIIRDKRAILEKDIRLQLSTLKNNGLVISHVDSHHYVHQLPELLDLLLPIMNEFGIAATRYNPGFYVSEERKRSAMELMKRFGVRHPDGVCDLTVLLHDARNLREETFDVIEVVLHTEYESSDPFSPWRFGQHSFLIERPEYFTPFELVDFGYFRK